MQNPDQSLVQVTPIVFDFLSIQISDKNFENTLFAYRIINKSKQLVRKGNFKGLSVQLRLAHLENGIYQLELNSIDEAALLFSFEKKSTDNPEYFAVHTH